MTVTQIIHVRNDSTGGRAVQRAQAQMKRWRERGASVTPVRADDLDHPYGRVCPVCSPPEPETGLFLTKKELRLLRALNVQPGRPHSPRSLITLTPDIFQFCSPASLHSTAASLVRKGLIKSIPAEVQYQILPAGREALR